MVEVAKLFGLGVGRAAAQAVLHRIFSGMVVRQYDVSDLERVTRAAFAVTKPELRKTAGSMDGIEQ